ncbi:hypothetical protein N2152v2_002011 [Parachlorella kessleri]
MAGTKASEATPNGGSAGAQGKKKVKAQQPLPAVEALADKLPFCVEVKPKLGRHTVAKADLPAGTLVMLEEPAFTTTRTRVGLHVCHRCFASIPPPSPPKRSKALADKPAAEQQQEEANQQQQIGTALEISKAEGASAQQQGAAEEDEQVPAALNPCLPRYCLACAGKNAELDARLAAVRARLLAVCKKHGVEPELLQLLLLLDTGRAGVKAQDIPAGLVPEGAAAPPVVRCGPADLDQIPSVWDRKSEGWRRAVVSATRALHQELVALAESGAVPGYQPSSLVQLQGAAGAIALSLQGIGPEGSSTEPGLGLFPALNLFAHSCAPNCAYVVSGQTLQVRTLGDVPAGMPLTVSYVPLYDPRPARRDNLRQQRGLPACGCERCAVPIEQSNDRFLEGVWCLRCRTEVLVQLPQSDKWEQQYMEQQEKEAAKFAVAAALSKPSHGAGPKKIGAKRGKKAGTTALQDQAAGAGAAAVEQVQEQGVADGAERVAAAAAESHVQQAEPEGSAMEKSNGEAASGESPSEAAAAGAAASKPQPEPVIFWRCCGCGHLERARGHGGYSGPQDVDEQASTLYSQALMYLQMKGVSQAEAMLDFVRNGVNARLHPYNTHCLDAMEPLLQIQARGWLALGMEIIGRMRKGDTVNAFNTALHLWEAQRLLLDLPTPAQLGYLLAFQEAARTKASSASSAVVKKQFERKVKAATIEIAYLRKVLYGQQ